MTENVAPRTALLELEGVHAGYDDLAVLFGVALHVADREVVTLIGSNGAGKTTTINAISGLVKSTQGRISFAGNDIARIPAYERVVSGLVQVPEGRRVFPFMSVGENLELGAYGCQARPAAVQRLQEVLDLLPRLKQRWRQLAGTLSGGEQQMLAIGRGLMSRPRLLMLDEPTLGLAPKMVALVFETIEAIREQAVSVLLVEQNVHHALRIADRGYVLEHGRISLHGPSCDLLEDARLKKAYLGL